MFVVVGNTALYIYRNHKFNFHEVFWRNSMERVRHRTNGWYEPYQPLVSTVPDIGSICTNGWYHPLHSCVITKNNLQVAIIIYSLIAGWIHSSGYD